MAARGWMYAKMGGVFATCCIGGPALMYYLTPAEGEVFKRFNPDLQKRNLELREQRLKNNEEFLTKLIEYSKSDKPIWVVAAEEEKREKAERIQKAAEALAERDRVREEMRRAQADRR
ncbi:Assembly factor cbp4 [Cladophialophora chaetospira]|uniref:Cytochrome b mRNA-processing protein 4 n=1 Tax=Cladophialophora chaetospira TaxID=386627 RepID=A0AA39CK45_9EURO|nr:Assembly factor cbp4 [Cladophialophora chaetospira]